MRSEGFLALEGEASEHKAHDHEAQNRHLQIGAHDDGITVLLQVTFCGSCDLRGVGCSRGHSGLLFHERDSAGCNGHSGVVTSGVAGEEGCCHGGNLEQNETGDKAQHEKPGHHDVPVFQGYPCSSHHS